MGVISALVYIAVLAALAIHPPAAAAALASSPAAVAHGQLLQLLSSGLVVEGPALPQIGALAVVLLVAVRRLGQARTWLAAIGAHVGATLLAYVLVAGLWLADRGIAAPVLRAPDYGISVVFVGVLGALTRQARPSAVRPVAGLLAALWLIWWWLAGSFDPIVLANLEHTLGFTIGAACAALLAPERAAAGGRSSGATAQLKAQSLSNGGVP